MRVTALLPALAERKKGARTVVRMQAARVGQVNAEYDEQMHRTLVERATRLVPAKARVDTAYGDLVAAARFSAAPAARTGVIQRKCAACGGEPGKSGECSACDADESERKMLHLKPQPQGTAQARLSSVPSVVNDVLSSPGQPLEAGIRSMFESRFGHDFGAVRVHADATAARSAQAIQAMAYTHGDHIVFGREQYAPRSPAGQRVLAHELTHVVQQHRRSGGASGRWQIGAPDSAEEHEADAIARKVVDGQPIGAIGGGAGADIQRACLPDATCNAPIPGSSQEFGVREENREVRARRRRARMSPGRQRSTGQTGPARQLEKFLEVQAPGLRANIHGIFIDHDLSPDTGALTADCASMVPPITGATKPCVFVHGNLNQEALAFNTSAAATIGGKSREDWRTDTVVILTHEVQHVLFDNAAHPAPAGAAGCARAAVADELSELNAIMSEFPVMFRAIPAGAPAGDPARVRLADWFDFAITNDGESIRGILETLRCTCDCGPVDAWVIDTFNFVSASWTLAERIAFNTELRKPVWALSWPL